MTFGDIPFYFSREEWGSLDPAQRDLVWDIKRENSRNVALGKHWAQPGLWGDPRRRLVRPVVSKRKVR